MPDVVVVDAAVAVVDGVTVPAVFCVPEAVVFVDLMLPLLWSSLSLLLLPLKMQKRIIRLRVHRDRKFRIHYTEYKGSKKAARTFSLRN